jgi:hypothetical protein
MNEQEWLQYGIDNDFVWGFCIQHEDGIVKKPKTGKMPTTIASPHFDSKANTSRVYDESTISRGATIRGQNS